MHIHAHVYEHGICAFLSIYKSPLIWFDWKINPLWRRETAVHIRNASSSPTLLFPWFCSALFPCVLLWLILLGQYLDIA